MIKINKEYLLQNINTIIKEKRNYGKSNIGNNKKIIISTYVDNLSNIDNKVLATIDNLSRIYYYLGYNPYKEILITDNNIGNINNIKNKLDSYRININNFISTNNLYEKGIVDEVLLKYQYTNKCSIKNNSLYLILDDNKEIELTDEYGNYSDLLYLISYNYNTLLNNEELIIILPSNNKYNIDLLIPSLQFISANNNYIIKKIDNKEDINEEDINLFRYKLSIDKQSSNIYNRIDDIEKKLFNILYKEKIDIIDKYNIQENEISYNILNNLYEFNKIILLSKENININYINNYIEELISLLNSYLNKNNTYTKDELNLLYASKIVLDNALDLIGIIPNY